MILNIKKEKYKENPYGGGGNKNSWYNFKSVEVFLFLNILRIES